MQTLNYKKGDSIGRFIDNLKQAVLVENAPMLLVMEPGDSTHYEFVVCTLGDCLFWAQVRESGGWCARLPQGFCSLEYITEKAGVNANQWQWTLMLVLELHHRLCGIDYRTYNFAKGEKIVGYMADDSVFCVDCRKATYGRRATDCECNDIDPLFASECSGTEVCVCCNSKLMED